MLIRVTTNYGHAEGGKVILKTPQSAAFQIDEAKGYELIERGIAVEAEEEDADTEIDEALTFSAKTRADLVAIATARGIKVPARASKADILAALEAEGAQ